MNCDRAFCIASVSGRCLYLCKMRGACHWGASSRHRLHMKVVGSSEHCIRCKSLDLI